MVVAINQKKENTKIQKPKKIGADYFQSAKSWADDLSSEMIARCQRYKMAFWLMTGLFVLMVFCVMVLVPAQHTELVVVHEGTSGYTWLSTTKGNEKLPATWRQTQSNIARYEMARESYDPVMYRYQTREVGLFSASDVEAQYEIAQAQTNKMAPINVLGAKGYRTVVVNSVLQQNLASKNVVGKGHHVNLALVNFVTNDHFFSGGTTVKTGYTALVSWEYRGVPETPDAKLRNYNGFTITKYLVTPVNSGNT